MIIRELITMLGVEFDDSGAKKASSALDEIKSLAGKVTAVLGGGALVGGLYKMVESAAATGETLSLLRVTFGEYNADVLKWADSQADALGRSKYSLREYAAQIGVVAKGLTNSSSKAKQIGTEFAALAVDMGAFFDKSDEDVMEKLRSGLTGETEPLKALGIVLNEATYEATRLRLGMTQQYKDMMPAQQAWVRYKTIIESATAVMATGAAGREAQSFGNQVKQLKEAFKDFSIDVGNSFLPIAQDILKLLLDWKPEMKAVSMIIGDLAKKTYFFEWIAGILAFKTGIGLINMMVRLYKAARIAALLGVVNLTTTLASLGAAMATASAAMSAMWAAMAPVLIIAGMWAIVVATFAALGVAIYALGQTLVTGTNFLAEWTEKAFGLQSAIVEGIGYIVEWAGRCWDDIEAGASAVGTFFAGMWEGVKNGVAAAVDWIREKLAAILPDRVIDVIAALGVDLRSADAAATSRTGTAGTTAPPGSTTSASTVNNTTGPVQVVINGNATPATAGQVGKEVQAALAQNNRNLAKTAPGATR